MCNNSYHLGVIDLHQQCLQKTINRPSRKVNPKESSTRYKSIAHQQQVTYDSTTMIRIENKKYLKRQNKCENEMLCQRKDFRRNVTQWLSF